MSYKAYCDSCEEEIDFQSSNQHSLWLEHGKLGKISLVITVMEKKERGEECKHFNTCAKCIREIGRTLLAIIPEPDNGKEAKPSLDDI